MTLSPGFRLERFEILSRIGAGGMGEVYRARDTELHRDVAVKILPPAFSADPDRFRRFRQEAQAAAALSHPNILSIFHVGLQDGCPYIVTELLEGETLRDRLRRGPMRLRESLEFGAGVAWGLAAAHAKGIVHRDVKPANLFITKDGRIKILDFGLARFGRSLPSREDEPTALAEQTDAGIILGTVGYMSPEQVRGEATDSRTDIFALGAVLYETLTARRAFDRPTPPETMSAILNDDPPSSAETSQQMPAPVSRVIRRCLEKNAEKRFQSAEDLGFALEGLVESGSSASVPAVNDRSRRWLMIALAIGILVAVLASAEYLRRRQAQTAPSPVASVELQRLTERGISYRVAVTPDGKYVAWVNRNTYEIRLLHVASGRDIGLLPESRLLISSLHFSPDGDYLYFVRRLNPEDASAYGVFRVPVVGGPATPLATDVGRQSSVTVSPDGGQIAYIEGSKGQIVSVDPNGQNRRIIAQPRANEDFQFVEWGRTPGRMAAVVGTSSGGKLVTIEVQTGAVRDFPNFSYWGGLGQPAWSADGNRIFAPATPLFTTGVLQVWSFDATSGMHTPLTASSTPFSSFTLSATATGTLVAITFVGSSVLWVADPSGQSHPVSSIRGEGTDGVVWVDQRIATSTGSRIILHEPDGREPTYMPGTSTNYYGGVTRCGPGHIAYLAGTPDRGTFIARTDVSTGSMTHLTDGPSDFVPSCTQDGSTLVFLQCTQTIRCNWMKKPLNGGESSVVRPAVIDLPNEIWPELSPDGTQLLLFRAEKGNPFRWATVIPLSGGAVMTLTMRIPAGEVQGYEWAPDGKSVLVIRRDAKTVDNIWSAPIDGREPKQITNFTSERIFSFDVAPSGQLAMSRGDWVTDIVMIKEVR